VLRNTFVRYSTDVAQGLLPFLIWTEQLLSADDSREVVVHLTAYACDLGCMQQLPFNGGPVGA
jgi:hypothetical protein